MIGCYGDEEKGEAGELQAPVLVSKSPSGNKRACIYLHFLSDFETDSSHPGEIMVGRLSALLIAGSTGAASSSKAARFWSRGSGCSSILDFRVAVGYVVGFLTLIVLVANDTHDG